MTKQITEPAIKPAVDPEELRLTIESYKHHLALLNAGDPDEIKKVNDLWNRGRSKEPELTPEQEKARTEAWKAQNERFALESWNLWQKNHPDCSANIDRCKTQWSSDREAGWMTKGQARALIAEDEALQRSFRLSESLDEKVDRYYQKMAEEHLKKLASDELDNKLEKLTISGELNNAISDANE